MQESADVARDGGTSPLRSKIQGQAKRDKKRPVIHEADGTSSIPQDRGRQTVRRASFARHASPNGGPTARFVLIELYASPGPCFLTTCRFIHKININLVHYMGPL